MTEKQMSSKPFPDGAVLPCPFCGDDAVFGKGRDEIFFAVYCLGCEAEYEAFTKEEAYSGWNRRTSAIDTEALARALDLHAHQRDMANKAGRSFVLSRRDEFKRILDTALAEQEASELSHE